jgi:hypothetical protein
MRHLVESTRAAAPRRTGFMAASTVMHAALISAAAMAGTRQIIEQMPRTSPDRIPHPFSPHP